MLLVFALMAAACGDDESTSNGSADTSEGDPIRIAAATSQTGAAAVIGTHWHEGLELAVDVVNDEWGGVEIDGERHMLELDWVDDASDPATGARVAQQFVTDGHKFVFGPGLGLVWNTAWGVLGQGEELMNFTPSSTASQYLQTPEGEYLFKVHPSFITQEAEAVGLDPMSSAAGVYTNYIIENYQPETVALLLSQDATGDNYRESYASLFEDAGVEVVYSESFPVETRDFGSYVAAIQSESPDVIVGPYLDSQLQPLMEQSVQVGMTSPLWFSHGGTTSSIANVAEDLENDFLFAVTTRAVANPEDESVADFAELYEEKFGEAPPATAYWTLSFYDPLLMLANAMQIAGTSEDLDAITEALTSDEVTDYPNRVMDSSFSDIKLIEYNPQMGTAAPGGELTYVDP